MKSALYISAFVLLLAFGTILVSCNKTKESADTDRRDSIAAYVAPAVTRDSVEEPKAPGKEPLKDILFRFKNVSLTAEFGELWNDEGYFDEVHEDSIVVRLGLSAQMSGQRYAIRLDSSIQQVEIFQNYETSLTLMNGGPHIDLLGWKHYVGDWEQLVIADGGFQTAEYTDADFERFPEVTTAEIVEVVKDMPPTGDNNWAEIAAKCTSPQGFPCAVSISRITLKLVLTYTTGITVERFIIFEVPMGC
jgi:hypothetical protein